MTTTTSRRGRRPRLRSSARAACWARTPRTRTCGRSSTRTTLDGIAVAPIGPPSDAGRPDHLGSTDRAPTWDIRAHISGPDAATANEALLADLDNGATSLWVGSAPASSSTTCPARCEACSWTWHRSSCRALGRRSPGAGRPRRRHRRRPAPGHQPAATGPRSPPTTLRRGRDARRAHARRARRRRVRPAPCTSRVRATRRSSAVAIAAGVASCAARPRPGFTAAEAAAAHRVPATPPPTSSSPRSPSSAPHAGCGPACCELAASRCGRDAPARRHLPPA